MTDNERKWISDNAGVGIEDHESEIPPSFDGPILTIGAQGKTVEFPISHGLYENIKKRILMM